MTSDEDDRNGGPSNEDAASDGPDPFAGLTFDEQFISDAAVREESAAERVSRLQPPPPKAKPSRAARGSRPASARRGSEDGVVVNLRSKRSAPPLASWAKEQRLVLAIAATLVLMNVIALIFAP